jgi:putative tryptophan/tyrosine transport system substrate-binding protein
MVGIGRNVVRRREFIAGVGSVLTWPSAIRAQQPATPKVGFLFVGVAEKSIFLADAFRRGLTENGYVEGKNLVIEYRWADRYDQLPSLAADLVNRGVAVLFASPLSGGLAAKNATRSIPIVFESGGDPVDFGLVDSLNRPGGNITGISELTQKLVPKRLELLREALPRATAFSMLVNPMARSTASTTSEAADAARTVGVKLHFHNAKDNDEIVRAFAEYAALGTNGLLINPGPLFLNERESILGLATRYSAPVIYFDRIFAVSGGLMSYGASLADLLRQAGAYVARILKGEKPADLPVQQPTKFELVINLKAAKQLALSIPPTLLARADEVIE